MTSTQTDTQTDRYDTRCYFSVRSKATARNQQIKSGENKKVETNTLRSIDKQSGKSAESVVKKKRKAAVGMICRKGRS